MDPAFLPGGRITAGAVILKLDPVDYELAVTLRQAEVEQATLNLAKEQGMQEVARHEWDLIDSREKVSPQQKELILRKPHLEAAQAALDSAQAALRQAELNLERTAVRAPFDAVVLSKAVDVGAQVTAQTSLGQLAGTDEFWVEATLPVDQLHWIGLPDGPEAKGAPVDISIRTGQGETAVWKGYVKQLKSQLESKGRLAQLLLSIPDPLASEEGRPTLLLDSHVQVELAGPELTDVFVLPRRAIHDGRDVWLLNDESHLEIRPVDLLWSDADQVVVRDGLQAGEQLVVSDLSAPAAGMPLKSSEASGETQGE
jgi:RND family efflux transporter MFP subunit